MDSRVFGSPLERVRAKPEAHRLLALIPVSIMDLDGDSTKTREPGGFRGMVQIPDFGSTLPGY
jgi:hypothetical protein